jgi:hypothetical protein
MDRPTRSVVAPTPSEDVRVSVRVHGDVREARLRVEWRSRHGTGTADLRAAGDAFEGTIPRQADQTLVTYRFVALRGDVERVLDFDPHTGEPLRYFVYDPASLAHNEAVYCLELPKDRLEELVERPGYSRFDADFVSVRDGVARIRQIQVQVRGGVMTRKWLKRHWLLRFSERQPFEGNVQLNLRCGWRDATGLRELMACEVFRRAGVPTPQGELVRVHVNGEFFGLFTAIPSLDERFLARHGLPGGVLYEPAAVYAARTGDRTDGRSYPNLVDYEVHYKKVTARRESHEDLRAFVEGYHDHEGPELEAWFDRHLDVERYLSYLAITALLFHWDSVFHNFVWCLDREGSGKWVVLPWDMNLTWDDNERRGAKASYLLGTREIPHRSGQRRYWNRLRDAFLSVRLYRARYMRRIYDLVRGPFEPKALQEEWTRRFRDAESALRLDRARWGTKYLSMDKRYVKGKVPPGFFKDNLDLVTQFIKARSRFLNAEANAYLATTNYNRSDLAPSPPSGGNSPVPDPSRPTTPILLVLVVALLAYGVLSGLGFSVRRSEHPLFGV